MPQKQKSDKPLFMRIIMLAIAAVMVLGIVIVLVISIVNSMKKQEAQKNG